MTASYRCPATVSREKQMWPVINSGVTFSFTDLKFSLEVDNYGRLKYSKKAG